MATERAPSSHGSLHEGDGRDPQGEDSGFDSDEYREYLKFKRRSRRRRDGDEEDREPDSKGNGGPAPEWDGQTLPFQDWLVKARLWLATTKAKKRAQGPMILQKLSGPPFQAFKHWAKNKEWLEDERGGHALLDAMDLPEHYGEDKEEDLLASLSKITYHLRRGKEEKSRDFFARWDESLRKVDEHEVQLPDKFLGFLMVNALGLDDMEIKTMLSFTRGSIETKDIREFSRKHEMKLHSREVGAEKKSTKSAASVHHIQEMPDTDNDEDYNEMEQALNELREGEAAEEQDEEDWAIDEHEAAEILATTMNTQQKKSFTQSWKLKKAKELARGYTNWKRDGKGKGKGKGSLADLKSMTRRAICGKVGHWHRECPDKGTAKDKGADHRDRVPKEVHLIQTEDKDFTEAYFCGFTECDREQEETIGESAEVDSPETMGTKETLVHYDVQKEDQKDYDAEELHYTIDYNDEKDAKLDEVTPVKLGLYPGERLLSDAERRHPNVETPDGEHFAHIGTDVTDFCQYKDRFPLGGVSRNPEHEIYWNEEPQHETPDEACATIDTGCQRMAIGLETLDRLIKHLPEDLPVLRIRQENRFRSVHGHSNTKFVAAIPSSLGHHGSILRPAIFDQDCSKRAPFLISLPFLLHCRAILHLDPEAQLRVHFRRYVPLHRAVSHWPDRSPKDLLDTIQQREDRTAATGPPRVPTATSRV